MRRKGWWGEGGGGGYNDGEHDDGYRCGHEDGGQAMKRREPRDVRGGELDSGGRGMVTAAAIDRCLQNRPDSGASIIVVVVVVEPPPPSPSVINYAPYPLPQPCPHTPRRTPLVCALHAASKEHAIVG